MEGLVLRIDAKVCHVQVEGRVHALPLRGKLFAVDPAQKRPIAVGDRVRVTLDGQGGAIDEVLPRTSKLARRAAGEDGREQVLAANVNQVLVVAAITEPRFEPLLVDQILAGAERERLPALLAITKVDRDRHERAPHWRAVYERLGYPVHLTTLKHPETFEPVRAALKDRITVLCGTSGVGKSSLLNALVPGLDLKTGKLGRSDLGRHTTTHTQLLALPGGGHVLDTPGIRAFFLHGVDPAELPHWFREFQPLLSRCAYSDCSHLVEPECPVRAAAHDGSIAPSRYASYRAMHEDHDRGRRR
ncbi:MAG: ribosome small subunit-dependent GTPase A [Planctomycetes bacterium]|nr:ribosome small subunit-dependent GTPase A [Planctomycetota bacterium]